MGDLVDGQGERQVDTVRIARAMVDSGAALIVAGNHEFNAVAWHLGEREHSDKNLRQHERFLAEVEEGSALHDDLVGWFKGLPLWLEVAQWFASIAYVCTAVVHCTRRLRHAHGPRATPLVVR